MAICPKGLNSGHPLFIGKVAQARFPLRIFNFGSRSDFDALCHFIVTDLKEKYNDIQRHAYTCRSETCTLESEREYWEKIYSHFEKRPVTLLGVEEEMLNKEELLMKNMVNLLMCLRIFLIETVRKG